jgi:hypothetical protein
MPREHGPIGSYSEEGPMHKENANENAAYSKSSVRMKSFLAGEKIKPAVTEQEVDSFIEKTEKMIAQASGLGDMAKENMKSTVFKLREKQKDNLEEALRMRKAS